MKDLLPNSRFLSINSLESGRDWLHLSRLIDEQLDSLSLDLAEESVYLIFDSDPFSASKHMANCEVARSVIGSKKNLEGPLRLTDWVQAPVYKRVLSANLEWDELFGECCQEWMNLQSQGENPKAPFIIVAKRRLNPELNLSLEVLFKA